MFWPDRKEKSPLISQKGLLRGIEPFRLICLPLRKNELAPSFTDGISYRGCQGFIGRNPSTFLDKFPFGIGKELTQKYERCSNSRRTIDNSPARNQLFILPITGRYLFFTSRAGCFFLISFCSSSGNATILLHASEQQASILAAQSGH